MHLKSFYHNQESQEADVQARLHVEGDILSATFELAGSLSNVVIPPLAKQRERKDELWKQTCFEIFLMVESSGRYWEVNLSPEGHWAIYQFESYRKGMQKEKRASTPEIQVHRQNKKFVFSVTWEVTDIPELRLALTKGDLAYTLTAVIEFSSGLKTYWAVDHAGEEPDFHRQVGRTSLHRP